MPEEEKRLIAELKDCDQDRLATYSALSHAQQCVSMDGYQQLVKAAEIARGKVDAVRVRLRSPSARPLRKKDCTICISSKRHLTGFRKKSTR